MLIGASIPFYTPMFALTVNILRSYNMHNIMITTTKIYKRTKGKLSLLTFFFTSLLLFGCRSVLVLCVITQKNEQNKMKINKEVNECV